MTAFVLDCSITLAWCFEDEATPATDALQEQLLDSAAVAPSIWPIEVANVLAGCERRGRLTPAVTAKFLARLDVLPITIDDQTARRATTDILALSRAERLTAYDAAYLELALRRGLPLATLDRELRAAASRLGVPLLGL